MVAASLSQQTNLEQVVDRPMAAQLGLQPEAPVLAQVLVMH